MNRIFWFRIADMMNSDRTTIYDGQLLFTIAEIIILIILYPLSFIVSLTATIFSIFLIIFLLLFRKFPDFLDPFLPDDSAGWDEVFFVFVLFLLITLPISIPFEILNRVVYFYILLSPLFPNGAQTRAAEQQPNDIINLLWMVLNHHWKVC